MEQRISKILRRVAVCFTLLPSILLGKIIEVKTFNDLDRSRPHVIEFYSPQCGHCKNMVAIYEELSNNHQDVVFHRVNIAIDFAKAKAIADKIGVKNFGGVPHFVFVDAQGKVTDAKGEKKLAELNAHVNVIKK